MSSFAAAAWAEPMPKDAAKLAAAIPPPIPAVPLRKPRRETIPCVFSFIRSSISFLCCHTILHGGSVIYAQAIDIWIFAWIQLGVAECNMSCSTHIKQIWILKFTGLTRLFLRQEVGGSADPPTSLLSRWLWRLRRHNQREKRDLGEAKPPQTPPPCKLCNSGMRLSSSRETHIMQPAINR